MSRQNLSPGRLRPEHEIDSGQTPVALSSFTACASDSSKPRWDAGLRELWFGEILVKRFKRVATVQETILATFEEEGWPARILDPLPPSGTRRNARQRLRESIANLNEHLLCAAVRFEADGSGEGVRWRRLSAG